MRFSLLLVSLMWALSGVEGPASAGAASSETGKAMTTEERRVRERELRREVTRIQDELRALNQEPTGVTKSVVPRSELADQPTRRLRESMESAPGVTARQGPGGRDVNLSIRGSGK